jgi:hypothetical protein
MADTWQVVEEVGPCDCCGGGECFCGWRWTESVNDWVLFDGNCSTFPNCCEGTKPSEPGSEDGEEVLVPVPCE